MRLLHSVCSLLGITSYVGSLTVAVINQVADCHLTHLTGARIQAVYDCELRIGPPMQVVIQMLKPGQFLVDTPTVRSTDSSGNQRAVLFWYDSVRKLKTTANTSKHNMTMFASLKSEYTASDTEVYYGGRVPGLVRQRVRMMIKYGMMGHYTVVTEHSMQFGQSSSRGQYPVVTGQWVQFRPFVTVGGISGNARRMQCHDISIILVCNGVFPQHNTEDETHGMDYMWTPFSVVPQHRQGCSNRCLNIIDVYPNLIVAGPCYDSLWECTRLYCVGHAGVQMCQWPWYGCRNTASMVSQHNSGQTRKLTCLGIPGTFTACHGSLISHGSVPVFHNDSQPLI